MQTTLENTQQFLTFPPILNWIYTHGSPPFKSLSALLCVILPLPVHKFDIASFRPHKDEKGYTARQESFIINQFTGPFKRKRLEGRPLREKACDRFHWLWPCQGAEAGAEKQRSRVPLPRATLWPPGSEACKPKCSAFSQTTRS